MPVILVVLIQIMCGVHVVKTGQERYWLYLIIGLPGIGCAVYALAILVPDLLGSRDGKRLIRQAHDKMDPERHVRMLRDELVISETSQNHVRLADELARIGQMEEAVVHYQKALTGIFTHDPDIMVKLAKAQFDSHDVVSCKKTLETLIQMNPDYQSQDGHLLYARTLQELGDLHKADEEFRVLVEYYTGPEARFRYYLMLREKGELIGAKHQLETITVMARRAKPHYRKLHKEWLVKANQELKTFA
ncbi:hypothetical protein [Pragia fontium]|uniref:Tetratricopeptide repeat protein n=1 Tax=Pragia fontium DSM 5563 = ATCC 49100 TaxID=1122977 RepID=A0AAJ4W960_9GAMM|nr:hypothetical protein [Pragia fontium]SFC43213.1 hypothetical protein SAMN02745723_102343 [Pragia fontium DSM 5563 = ATCC 49100]VEJ54912.1 Uncharacterized protein conserved in bacteria containing a divergent form of TPR repeats [Pragia fontium]